jgi:hypothetical protein
MVTVRAPALLAWAIPRLAVKEAEAALEYTRFPSV